MVLDWFKYVEYLDTDAIQYANNRLHRNKLVTDQSKSLRHDNLWPAGFQRHLGWLLLWWRHHSAYRLFYANSNVIQRRIYSLYSHIRHLLNDYYRWSIGFLSRTETFHILKHSLWHRYIHQQFLMVKFNRLSIHIRLLSIDTDYRN